MASQITDNATFCTGAYWSQQQTTHNISVLPVFCEWNPSGIGNRLIASQTDSYAEIMWWCFYWATVFILNIFNKVHRYNEHRLSYSVFALVRLSRRMRFPDMLRYSLRYRFVACILWLPAWWALWLPWWPPAGCNNALMYLLIFTMNFCYCLIVVFCWK